MKEQTAFEDLSALLEQVRPHVIVSPPRSASTALARAFFNHSHFATYVHEPCGELYHQHGGVRSVLRQFRERQPAAGHTLVKYMSFQLGGGELAELVLRNTGGPPLFPLRDPTLTIESRLRRVLADLEHSDSLTDSDLTLVREAMAEHRYGSIDHLVSDRYLSPDQMGIVALVAQIAICDRLGLPFVLVDAHELRAEPRQAMRLLSEQWGLEVEPEMLHWRDQPFPDHGVLGEQSRWFDRVSRSNTFLPPKEEPISLQHFPATLRPIVEQARSHFDRLAQRPENLLRTRV